MKTIFAAALFSAVLLSCGSANATYYHHIPKVTPPTPSAPGSDPRFFCVVNPGGAFVCAVLIGIIVHEVFGPKCADSSPRNVKYGWDQPTFWRPLCAPAAISVRG